MIIALLLLFMVFHNASSSSALGTNVAARPDVVNIGAIITFDSIIGKIAKLAIAIAVEDVNSDPEILNGTKLTLKIQNTGSNDFLGIVDLGTNFQTFSCILRSSFAQVIESN